MGSGNNDEAGPRYRRSPDLVAYWSGGRLVCHPYRHRVAVSVTADLLTALGAFDEPTTVQEAAVCLGAPAEAVQPLVDLLTEARLLEPASAVPTETRAWDTWAPAAAFFHFATRDGTFQGDQEWVDPARFTATGAVPDPFRRYPGAPLQLPQASPAGALAGVLEQRRTHRAFGADPLTRDDLAALLHHTWRARRRDARDVWFRTSPSAGARHPIEPYVGILAVEGIEPGVYHYDSRDGSLACRRAGLTRAEVAHWLAGQDYFSGAAVVVFMTSVFSRTWSRYPSPRAYRSILIDAGHLAQTFCLVATERKLAPFTTMAFRESEIEEALQLDGAEESVMYVAGVGREQASCPS